GRSQRIAVHHRAVKGRRIPVHGDVLDQEAGERALQGDLLLAEPVAMGDDDLERLLDGDHEGGVKAQPFWGSSSSSKASWKSASWASGGLTMSSRLGSAGASAAGGASAGELAGSVRASRAWPRSTLSAAAAVPSEYSPTTTRDGRTTRPWTL